MDEYNEMMDQYEKDRLEQTHTWICKDAVMNELTTIRGLYSEDPKAKIIVNMIASILNRLPEHRFCLMDEMMEDMSGELPYEQ